MRPSVSTGCAREVFFTALRLGLTSFGGPIAHLGYFERTYVRQRGWLSSEQYGSLISLCQLLPGPTSSQVGFLIGLQRAGWLGAVGAWAGFTLPSAVLMYAFALLAPAAPGPTMAAVLRGLMWTAVVIVAQAVWSMARTLTPDVRRQMIAVCAFAVLVLEHSGESQIVVLAAAALAGALVCRARAPSAAQLPISLDTRTGWFSLSVFCILLAGLPLTVYYMEHNSLTLAAVFYRAGALVFGGGHVVLPLLQQALVPEGWISQDRFLAGYGIAQAMPGPLFTFAAYLGAACAPPGHSAWWALTALMAIFLPGLSLSLAGLSLFGRLASNTTTQAVIRGVNAGVVGLLAAALYDPVWKSAVLSVTDGGIVLAAFVLLQRFATPPIVIAGLCVAAAMFRELLAS